MEISLKDDVTVIFLLDVSLIAPFLYNMSKKAIVGVD
jgi:hypothetical protein